MKKYLVILLLVIFSFSAGILLSKNTNFHFARKQKIEKSYNNKGDATLLLSNFESQADLQKWETVHATLERVPEYNTEGTYCGKMVFSGNVECSNVLMGRFLKNNPQYGDWSAFDSLRFNILNPDNDTSRLILKIQDSNGKSWQRNMYLPAKDSTEIKIYIGELKNNLDVSRMRQVNFFRWNPPKEAVFYIDNMRLVSQTKAAQGNQAKAKENSIFIEDKSSSDYVLGVESALTKVFTEPSSFTGKAADAMAISLARNEYESSQLAIYAKKELRDVKIEIADLKASIDGSETYLDRSNIKCYLIGYVETKKPYYNVSYVGLWPDPLEEKTSFAVSKGTVQPIWIEVYAPAGTLPGDYSGSITLQFTESQSAKIPLKVHVWNLSLPETPTLRTAFGFYDNRLRKMYPQEKGEKSQEYNGRIYELKKKYYMDMIRHKVMPIGNFDLDNGFTIKEIKFYTSLGLNAFAVGKHGSNFGNNWPKEPEKLTELMSVYKGYAQLLKASELIDKAYIYTFDEPPYGNAGVDEVTKAIHGADPDLKNMICFHMLPNPESYPGWGDDIDIWCIRNAVFTEKIAKFYKDKGKEVWMYVSSPEWPYPSLVIDYPAVGHRITPWMCWKYGATGYLSWCINFWENSPWEKPMGEKFKQNGNGFLYYPGKNGPVASIRLKVTRDGIDDYEYLCLLAQRLKTAEERNVSDKELLIRAKRLLNIDESIVSAMDEYANDPQIILKRRAEIAVAIEELDKVLGGI